MMMDLFITGVVYDLSTLRERIENATEDVVLHIDSPGGDAFEGLETAHCIANAKCKVTARVGFLAASAAAIIALACDAVEIDKNSLLMLHNCWTISIGSKTQLRSDADGMEAIDKVMHNIIDEHCDNGDIFDAIEKGDVYLTGEEAVAIFDHVSLVATKRKDGMAAEAPLVNLVQENRELRKQVEDLRRKNVYTVSENLQALMEQAKGV